MNNTRKIKRILNDFLNLIKFKSFNLTKSKQIIFIWIVLTYISLFSNWLLINNNKSENIFNNITGFSWVIIFILISFLFFILFSRNYKEKIKKSLKLNLKDYNFFIYFSIIIWILWISILSNIIWLKRFQSDISYWNWTILLISASIIIFIWAILLKKETKEKNYICINEAEGETIDKKWEKNMKLPL